MDLPFSSDRASTPGYRPRFKVAAGGGAASGGGLLGAVQSLLSAPASDPWAENLAMVDVVLAPAPAVSSCRLRLGPGAGAPAVQVGDALDVRLGFDDVLVSVFSGTVWEVTREPRAVGALLAGKARLLLELRENASFEQQSFGDIVGQWAAAAGVDTATVEDGVTYPFLAVDDSRSVWEWIARLAAHAGLIAWCDGEGKLHCQAPPAAAARTFTVGEDVIELRVHERGPVLGAVRMVGEGAAGSQGAAAWPRLLKSADAASAQAGLGAPARLFREGALRSLEAVQGAVRARAACATALARVVHLRVPGAPELALADRFHIAGGDAAGDYVVARIRHRLDKRSGFLSEIVGRQA